MKFELAGVHEPQTTAQACMIWLHGLGADGSDMMMLVQELNVTSIPMRHVFVNAPIRPVTINGFNHMPAWYDIIGFDLSSREDAEGILQSEAGINDIIAQQIATGIPADRIFLAGFSQGGAMALFAGLRQMVPLAGIVCLSGYLPLARTHPLSRKAYTTPIFMATGKNDPTVLPEWVVTSKAIVEQQGYKNINWHMYPMEHCVCAEELHDLANWLKDLL